MGRESSLTQKSRTKRKIRVLIVDDSALARKILSDGLSKDPDIEVIKAVRDPYAAQEVLVNERPDVITLDVEMPRMDGVTFLKKYMPLYPTPTIIVSALTEQGKRITINALEAGAVDVVAKPKVGVVDKFPEMMADLCERVKAAARINVNHFKVVSSEEHGRPDIAPPEPPPAMYESTDQVIAIGASAGGVAALSRIIPTFPMTAPGIVIVQHMPPGFTTSFAERLDSLSAMQVKEAAHWDRVRPGLVLLAPGGDRHMEVRRSGGEYRVALIHGEKVSGHQPSVDVLFHSVAKHVGRNAAAVLMTGMGSDGAEGLLAIRLTGGATLAQDEKTCVVFGMPRVAWEKGGAEKLIPLESIPTALLQAVKNSRTPSP
jgi:two-component system chemotaxis response regulator CheB